MKSTLFLLLIMLICSVYAAEPNTGEDREYLAVIKEKINGIVISSELSKQDQNRDYVFSHLAVLTESEPLFAQKIFSEMLRNYSFGSDSRFVVLIMKRIVSGGSLRSNSPLVWTNALGEHRQLKALLGSLILNTTPESLPSKRAASGVFAAIPILKYRLYGYTEELYVKFLISFAHFEMKRISETEISQEEFSESVDLVTRFFQTKDFIKWIIDCAAKKDGNGGGFAKKERRRLVEIVYKIMRNNNPQLILLKKAAIIAIAENTTFLDFFDEKKVDNHVSRAQINSMRNSIARNIYKFVSEETTKCADLNKPESAAEDSIDFIKTFLPNTGFIKWIKEHNKCSGQYGAINDRIRRVFSLQGEPSFRDSSYNKTSLDKFTKPSNSFSNDNRMKN